ncbi:hypothetical protein B9Q05_11225 [Candidatus Marsarchaeota G2 archaeon ECH_B_1]|uniref:Luciferase-like domain-containing protein n=1 Tax=Candidatus Marsarchaeota G2 archaeon ECH_B_1 TaxID=1978159 RepID=A0A2R6BMF2_9ARCH|nr:MAG: hypothetical protein B9Q05_11225 [Candidatus Marsarchaeota G2 archaeon ECH_B_1]
MVFKVKFGVLMFNWEPFSYNPKMYEQVATKAEALGYDSFFVTDHFMRPHAEGKIEPKRHSTLEAWSLLSYLASKTKLIRLGTCVTPIPLRSPQILAKTVATVDILSEGRVILGVGPGWDQQEFEAYGTWYDHAVRVEMTKEGVELIKKLWTQDVVNYEGKYYKAKNAVLEPKPVQSGGPPIWFGAIRDRMLKLAAELGDGWIPGRAVGATLEHYAKSAPKLREYLNRLGKTKFTFGVMGYFIEKGASTALPAIGYIDEAVKLIEEYKKNGCEYLVASFFPVEKYMELMTRFWKEIVPSFS